jgi:dihydroorotate dehydrogenase
MPGWSYHPVFRPLLFRLPAALSRDLALSIMGAIARLPLGVRLIDLLGHMQPPDTVHCTILGIDFPSPVGLSAGFDPHLLALPALARFGFGFIEIGPITVQPFHPEGSIRRDVNQEALICPEPDESTTLSAVCRRIGTIQSLIIPVGMRLRVMPEASTDEAIGQLHHLIDSLREHATFFSIVIPQFVGKGAWLRIDWDAVIGVVVAASPDRPVFLCVPPDTEPRTLIDLLCPARQAGVRGVVIDGGVHTNAGDRIIGLPARAASLNMVRIIHEHQPDCVIIAAGGVHEPVDALNLLQAGASLVEMDSGLVYSGPGLPKRTNEALAFESASLLQSRATIQPSSWLWLLLLGLSMILWNSHGLTVT